MTLIGVTAVVSMLSGMCAAAPSYLGTTGNILTPNDVILSPGAYSFNVNAIDIKDGGDTPLLIGAVVGVAPGLEVGAASVDSNAPGTGTDTVLSVKYGLLDETERRPSAVIGVVDAAGQINGGGNPSFYVLVGKNLTPAASSLTGEPVSPLKGYLGLGTGIYKGLFLGLDYSLNSRITIMAEYLSEADIKNIVSKNSLVNVGLRFALTDDFRGDISLIDGENFGFGISYTKAQ